jgi:tetratricopeptide (TPR) repeat protein
MTSEEQEEWIYIARLRGNRYYKAGRYDQAVGVYLGAVSGTKLRGDSEQMHILLCNLSSCLLAQDQPQQAIQFANQVLIEDHRHFRALERRAKAYTVLKQYDHAKADLVNASSPSIDEGSRRKLQTLLDEIRQMEKKEKGNYERSEEWPVVSTVGKFFSLPVKLYRAVEGLCRKRED